jgi:hypothetical protein
LTDTTLRSRLSAQPRNAQWDEYQAALSYRLSAEDEAFVDSLVATGHLSTAGFNDPKHPFFGRLTRLPPHATL